MAVAQGFAPADPDPGGVGFRSELWPRLTPTGAITPAKIFDPDPGRGLTPAKNFDPDPGRGLTPAKIFDPDPGRGLTPAKN